MKYFTVFMAALVILLVAISGCSESEQSEEIQDTNVESEESQVQVNTISVSSSAFEQGEAIPPRHTCDGENINPELIIGNLPGNTESLVLIVDGPDAPMGTFTHWIVWNIEPGAVISEDSIPGVQGLNDFKITDYSGPCPPSGMHRYFFRIYALDTTLEIPSGSERNVLEQEMQGHIIAQGDLMGTYSRS
ncbi:Raf kinase inhibitor-like YbhB/YbcL family protein [Methanohalophilus levihalophilus]|uniref:YbhB/YbcL family Raf kinase inhibitor-like protein n=1 Tax=Methanohalophilus levihalophilus TaxID=1431282 RepID=UPI001AE98674|nr:YbhB/YbcL family Raf kinase inhibitor-like protein [Methanohalophilus levihalophilus]MBP2029198.1 Raf kinase inhibitor-like YbhB/YbcL family protein [Methanohalophilus levihalophilus]